MKLLVKFSQSVTFSNEKMDKNEFTLVSGFNRYMFVKDANAISAIVFFKNLLVFPIAHPLLS